MANKLVKWIKRPYGWTLILFYIFAAICVAGAIVFSAIGQEGVLAYMAYAFYVLAAIALGYTIYTIVIYAPLVKKKIIGLMKKNKFTGKMYEQYGYRTVIFAIGSFSLSVANAVFNGSIGIINLSVWFFALGVYYLLLAVMRGGVLIYYRKKRSYTQTESARELHIREAGKYVMCGMGLILLPIALTGVIIETIVSDRAFVRSGMMIYVSAVYTVWKITMGIYNFFKARRGDELTVRAIRNVNLADAFVSVLALQTAMFHEFSPEESFGQANMITASAAGILTIVLGIFMIATGARRKILLGKMTDSEFESSEFNKPSVYKRQSKTTYFNGDKLYMFPPCTSTQCMGFLLAGGGKVIGIDSCTGGEADLIESAIMSLGGKVDCWFLTHAHFDHIDGLRELLERGNIKVEKICRNFPEISEIERMETADGGRSAISAIKLDEQIKAHGITEIKPEKGKSITVGHFNVLPLTDGSGHYKTLNPTSVVYRIDTQGKSILFLGDTEESHEDKILNEFPDKIACPIVQTAHHGQHGVSERFYNAVKPEVALWCTPDWLWNNDIGDGFNTGPFATLETRSWLEKFNVVNFRPTNETLIIE